MDEYKYLLRSFCITFAIILIIWAWQILFQSVFIWENANHKNSKYTSPNVHHVEKYYQEKIQQLVGGKRETILNDGTRVDIETNTEVIEVEFAHKWYEAIGQSAHYSIKTNKQPTIYLIYEGGSDDKYIERCTQACQNIKVHTSNGWILITLKIFKE
jgi:hypothetical protein